MSKLRRRVSWGMLGMAGAVVYQGGGCFSTDVVGQVFADQVGFTAATLVRVIVGGFFGV